MIEADMEALQVSGPVRSDAPDQFLRGNALGLGLEHDRRAVRVVCADEMHDISEHPLEAYPDVGLDVFHDMPDVERAIGVGQSGGDEEFADHPLSLQRAAAFDRRDRPGGRRDRPAAAHSGAMAAAAYYDASRNCS